MLTFSSTDPQEWSEALASCKQSLQSLDNSKLSALDKWYREELPALIQHREPPYILQLELKKLMEWKLTRGKWRPALMKFVSALSEDEVKAASEKAFAALPDLKQAITQLSALKGIGPATASAVLAIHAPDIAPFMSDEAMIATLGHAKDYSLKQYLLLAQKLQTKAEELNRSQKTQPGEELEWSPSDVERAIWASSVQPQESSESMETDSITGKLKTNTKKRLRSGKSKTR